MNTIHDGNAGAQQVNLQWHLNHEQGLITVPLREMLFQILHLLAYLLDQQFEFH